MKILVDIGHPAHVHYFRNLIKSLKKKDVEFLVLARDKDVTHRLLKDYDIPYKNKGIGGKRIFDRIGYTLRSLNTLHQEMRKFQPNVCISFYSPYLAIVARYHGIRHIMFNDTEGQPFFKQVVKLFKPEVYSPESYRDPIYPYQKLIPSFMELAYLHPEIYTADASITKITGKDYVLFRFVSSDASHDFGKKDLSWDDRKKLVYAIKKYRKIWISSENPLPEELKKYQLDVAPEKIHDVIAFSDLVIGESATMSSEAAMLGVPAVFLHHEVLGYIHELGEIYNMSFHFPNNKTGIKLALAKSVQILKTENSKCLFKSRKDKILADKENMAVLILNLINESFVSVYDKGNI